MYSYIYDSFLNQKKYERVTSKIENEITDLEIKGRICRLTLLNTIKATIEEEVRKGVKTIVIVGNDKTISRALDVIAPMDITLGIIPIGNKNKISDLFGIPHEVEACKILSARIIKNIDLGKVNESYFINNAYIKSNDLTINCDESYDINFGGDNHNINIQNNPNLYDMNMSESSPYLVTEIYKTSKEGFFQIFRKKTNTKSVFNLNRISISNKTQNIPIIIDGEKIIKSPAIIQKANTKLKVIVGKKRKI